MFIKLFLLLRTMKIAYIDHNYPFEYNAQKVIQKLSEKGVEIIAAQTWNEFKEIYDGDYKSLDGLLIHLGYDQQIYLKEILSEFEGVPNAVVTWSHRYYKKSGLLKNVFSYKNPEKIFEYFKEGTK